MAVDPERVSELAPPCQACQDFITPADSQSLADEVHTACLRRQGQSRYAIRSRQPPLSAIRGRAPHDVATASLVTLSGDALTDLLAGLAANSIGSFVKGLTPLRASVAGLFTTDILTKRGMTNSPASFNSL